MTKKALQETTSWLVFWPDLVAQGVKQRSQTKAPQDVARHLVAWRLASVKRVQDQDLIWHAVKELQSNNKLPNEAVCGYYAEQGWRPLDMTHISQTETLRQINEQLRCVVCCEILGLSIPDVEFQEKISRSFRKNTNDGSPLQGYPVWHKDLTK